MFSTLRWGQVRHRQARGRLAGRRLGTCREPVIGEGSWLLGVTLMRVVWKVQQKGGLPLQRTDSDPRLGNWAVGVFLTGVSLAVLCLGQTIHTQEGESFLSSAFPDGCEHPQDVPTDF